MEASNMGLRKAACAFVLVIFLVGMLPMAMAQPPKDVGKDKGKALAAKHIGKEKSKALAEKYKKARKEYADALRVYKNARKDYRFAIGKFRKTRKNEDSKVALYRAKAFILRADIAMVKYLRMLRVKVEHTQGITEEQKASILAELDGYSTWLEQQEEEIDKAQTMEELKTTAKNIREKWKDVRVVARKVSGTILVSKTENIISRAETLAGKVEARIPDLQAQGVDTAELEEWLNDFRAKIGQAKEKNDAAKEKFNQISSPEDANKLFREGHALVRDANKDLRQAYRDLRKILKAYKRHAKGKGKVVVSGTGRLTAHGDGRAYIVGNGTITVSAVNGTMIVSGNASVETNGTGNITELGDGQVKYQGFGSAVVTGEEITVRISGKGIDLVAEGTGKAILSGKGTYSVCGQTCLAGEGEERTGNWTAAGVSITMAAESEAEAG